MIFLLKNDPRAPFPAVKFAEQEPNGLLAVGGDLSPERLVNAYRHGVFPWYSDNEPILWWSPDPRTVLYPERVKISRSLGKTLRKEKFHVTLDTAFSEVIHACAEPRPKSPGTWLMPEMKAAYAELHEQGVAHSVEVWQEKQLVGGLYGVAIGSVFFGESMFSRVTDSSKVAFVFLCRHLHRWGYRLIDCQVYTEHFKRVVMLRMQNGTSKSPFCPRLSQRLFPFAAAALRPGHYVNPSQARIRLRTPTSNGSTAFRMPTLHPLWRKARRVCCERPTPTADYQPSFHSPWLAAGEPWCRGDPPQRFLSFPGCLVYSRARHRLLEKHSINA